MGPEPPVRIKTRFCKILGVFAKVLLSRLQRRYSSVTLYIRRCRCMAAAKTGTLSLLRCSGIQLLSLPLGQGTCVGSCVFWGKSGL